MHVQFQPFASISHLSVHYSKTLQVIYHFLLVFTHNSGWHLGVHWYPFFFRLCGGDLAHAPGQQQREYDETERAEEDQ